jgi:alkylhydroperoxidase family enzyme
MDEKLRAMLGFLEKLTRTPSQMMASSDVQALRAAGVSAAAAREAVYVAFLFGIMDRLADAFDFEREDERRLRWGARILLNLGYGGASVKG